MGEVIERAYVLREKIESMAEDMITDSNEAMQFMDLFPLWTETLSQFNRGYKVRDKGSLYQSIHPIVDVSQNCKPSEDTTNQLWQKIDNPVEEYPLWHQYIPGVGEPWRIGDKCTHNGKEWVCTLGNGEGINTWEPGAYGWEELT